MNYVIGYCSFLLFIFLCRVVFYSNIIRKFAQRLRMYPCCRMYCLLCRFCSILWIFLRQLLLLVGERLTPSLLLVEFLQYTLFKFLDSLHVLSPLFLNLLLSLMLFSLLLLRDVTLNDLAWAFIFTTKAVLHSQDNLLRSPTLMLHLLKFEFENINLIRSQTDRSKTSICIVQNLIVDVLLRVKVPICHLDLHAATSDIHAAVWLDKDAELSCCRLWWFLNDCEMAFYADKARNDLHLLSLSLPRWPVILSICIWFLSYRGKLSSIEIISGHRQLIVILAPLCTLIVLLSLTSSATGATTSNSSLACLRLRVVLQCALLPTFC